MGTETHDDGKRSVPGGKACMDTLGLKWHTIHCHNVRKLLKSLGLQNGDSRQGKDNPELSDKDWVTDCAFDLTALMIEKNPRQRPFGA